MGFRRLAALLGLAVLALQMPTSWSQSPAPGEGARESRVSDPEGDVRLVAPASNQSAPAGYYDHLDVRNVWISNETLDRIEAGIRLKKLDPPVPGDGVPFVSRAVVIRFDLGKSNYYVRPFTGAVSSFCPEGGILERRSYFGPGSYAVNSYCVKMVVERESNTIRFFLPRQYMQNETRAVFGPGHVLANLHAVARASTPVAELVPALVPGSSAPGFEDRAPDRGAGPEYRSVLGEGFSTGTLKLFAPHPIRVSNGESTTLVYPVLLTNEGPADANVILSVENPELSWNVRVPARLHVGARETIQFPSILSMGFTHRHGEIAYFQVRAEDANDPGTFSLLHLGVFWTDTPQPAGHHDKLWLHSGPGELSAGLGFPFGPFVCEFAATWMNPLEKDPGPTTTDEEVPSCTYDTAMAFFAPNEVAQPTVRWFFPLSPSLLIGLDFDLNRTGMLATEIRSPFSANRASLVAQINYFDPERKRPNCTDDFCTGMWVAIALGQSDPTSLPLGGRTRFEVPLAIRPMADFLPYKKEANILLQLNLTTDVPNHPPNTNTRDTAPLLAPKASLLVLPLVEYHDPIDQAFQAVGSLALKLQGVFEKPVNPGHAAVFAFILSNEGAAEQEIQLEAEGTNRDWARFTGDSTFRLAPRTGRNFTLVVDVPDYAAPGDRVELFVVAQSLTDSNVVAIARLRATVVDPEVQLVPDEAHLLEAEPEAGLPGLSILLTLLIVGAGAWWRSFENRRPG